MIRNYLDSVKLGVIEALFEHIGTGATQKEIQSVLPRNAKYLERVLGDLMDAKIVLCKNPETAPELRLFEGNTKSKIFTSLFNIDIELSDIEHERKRKIRAAMLAGPKKAV